MRILLLNQAFYPDVVSTAQHAADLAAALADAGHDVTVLASRRAYDDPSRLFPGIERWRGVNIVRVFSTAFGKSALWRRAIDFASFLLACIVRLAVLPHFDVVAAMTSPPLISVLAALYVRIKGGALLSWIMDLNPDEAIAAGVLRRDSLAARALGRLLQFSLDASSAVVVLDRFMRDRVVAKGVPASRVTVLPPWSHSAIVRYHEAGRARFRAAHGLTGKFVVMYSGNHSPCHPLDAVLGAARALRRERDLAFVFIGGGSEFRKVAGFADRHRLANILCLPYQPVESLADSLSAADLHLVVMGDRFAGIVHPCKIYNVLATGSPCLYIGPRRSHITEIAAQLPPDSVSCVAHGNATGVVRAIRSALSVGPRRSHAVTELAAAYSASRLLPQMVALVEDAGRAARECVPITAVVS